MRTFYDNDGRDRGSARRELLLGIVALLLAIVAMGLAGGGDYQDRCASLAPATAEEVR